MEPIDPMAVMKSAFGSQPPLALPCAEPEEDDDA